MPDKILDKLPDALITMDCTGKISYLNAAAERLTGYSTDKAIGLCCKDVIQSTVCGAGCPVCESGIRPKLQYRRECIVSTRHGHKVPVNSRLSALKNSDGQLTGWMEVIREASDRKRLEDDLKVSENRYRRFFEGSQDMIFVISKAGKIKEVNQAGVDLLGYDSRRELLALKSVEAVYANPNHWQMFKKQIDQHGFVKDYEAGFQKKDGTRLHCLLSGNAIRGKNGDLSGYEGIAKDITARMDAIRSFRRRHWELWLLNSVAFAMNKTQDLDKILMTALKKVLYVLNLSSGGIFLVDHHKTVFALRAQQGLTRNDHPKSFQLRLHDKHLKTSLLNQNLILKPEPIFPPFGASFTADDDRPSIPLICFLITAKEKASGFLAFKVPPHKDLTSGEDYHLLGSLGNFLGGAIENALLHQTVRRHREELKKLTARLFHSQEEERRRIARELHDETGQALTGINFTLESIEKRMTPDQDGLREHISQVKKQINHTHQEMRRISYRLHPAILTDLGLEPALESYLTRLSQQSGLEIDFRMVGFGERVDPDVETVLYRLSQEAFNNTLKHSRAGHFKLSIIKGYPKIIFLAEDDGIGFLPDEIKPSQHALGLLSMRERAAMLGGNFALRTSPGQGTRIRIEIPLKAKKHDH